MDFFTDAWQRFIASDTLIAAFITLSSPFILFFINKLITAKVKLRYGTVNDIVLLPNKPDGSPGVLKIRQIRIMNTGSKAADDIEIIFNWKPAHIEQYPHLSNGEEIKADGRYVVKVNRLNAKETFNINMATDVGDIPSIIYLRAKDSSSKIIEFNNVIWYSLPVRLFISFLLILGFFALCYGAVVTLGWVFFGRYPSF